jgi:hypothetical protein
VTATAPRVSEYGWRLSKGRTKAKVDSAIALVMVLDRATAYTPKKVRSPIFWLGAYEEALRG